MKPRKMLKYLPAMLVAGLGVCLITIAAAPITDLKPSMFRTVPINSTTAVVMSNANAFASAAAGAATGDANTFTLNASTTAQL